MTIDDEGGLSDIPISSGLITNMNTSHFTNNTTTGKIDINSDYVFTVNDYTPRTYTAALPGLALQNTPGVVKPRRGMALDDEGGLSAVPISSDLITNMNTSHFTNNIGTGKIDINSAYVAPSATKLATARNIAGTAFDGTANIDITYANLTNKPS